MRIIASHMGAGLVLCLVATATNLQAIQKTRASIAVPAGTEIKVRLNTPLDTGEAQAGQAFTGTLAEPVVAGGKTVVAKGTTVKGKVIEAVSSGRLKRPASITLALTSVSTQPLTIDGKSHLLRNVALIGGGAGAGAAVGGATGGKKGAAVGAAIGAGAGTVAAFLTGKNEIALPAEMVLPFVAGSGATAIAPASSARTERTTTGVPDQGIAQKERDSGGSLGRIWEVARVPAFTERDQQLIRGYYSGGKGLPPGLAKKGKLPPGLEKQLRRKGSLPPGLQKKYNAQPFPPDLERQLSPVPSGFSRVMIAGRAVLTDRNHTILDILALVQ